MTMPAGKSAKASTETAPPAEIQALLILIAAEPRPAGLARHKAAARDRGSRGAPPAPLRVRGAPRLSRRRHRAGRRPDPRRLALWLDPDGQPYLHLGVSQAASRERRQRLHSGRLLRLGTAHRISDPQPRLRQPIILRVPIRLPAVRARGSQGGRLPKPWGRVRTRLRWWRRQSRANSSLKPNSLLAGKIQGILFVGAFECDYWLGI